jgi:outer membrane protein TolC
VEGILQDKAGEIGWVLPPRLIVPELESRLVDPFFPDNPPAPRDDEAAARLMRRVDGKPGGALWAQTGENSPVEAGAWREMLPRGPDGTMVLDLEHAVRLALLHSRRYQTAKETLYLAALDVTEQRFRFRDRVGLGGQLENTRRGQERPGPGPEDRLDSNAGLTLQRRFATGAELAAGLANTVLWDLSANADSVVSSVVNVSLVQPLLRFQAREFILEDLTQSERSLLANVRRMKQFQQAFYISTVAGRNLNDGPSRGRVAGAATVTAGTPSASLGGGGFLGLLQTQQQIRNREATVASLRDSLARLQAAFDAGRISSRLQVDQARQALYDGQSGLLTAYAGFESAVDAYKVSLGLPPDLPVVVRDPLLERFELVDPRMSALQSRVAAQLDRVRDPDEVADAAALQAETGRLGVVAGEVRAQLVRTREDLGRLSAALPGRVEQLRELSRRPELGNVFLDPALFDPEILDGLLARLTKELGDLETGLEAELRNIEALAGVGVPEGQLERARENAVTALTGLSGQLLQLSLVQAAARLEAVTLKPLSMEMDEALALAEHHRLDWMNARASLVDAWRGIAVEAEALKTGLDLIVRGEVPTVGGDGPFNFDAETGVLRLGLQFDSPFRRLAERNDYREALVRYQDARRQYLLFEDVVEQSLRNTLRIVRLSQLSFEVRRAAVRVAIAQVDLARLRLNEPPKPGVAANQFGATTARDLVSALQDLLDAQNDFLNVWVGFEVLRMLLDYELGTMQLEESGLWKDPGTFRYPVPPTGGPEEIAPETAKTGKPGDGGDVTFERDTGSGGRTPVTAPRRSSGRSGVGRKR